MQPQSGPVLPPPLHGSELVKCFIARVTISLNSGSVTFAGDANVLVMTLLGEPERVHMQNVKHLHHGRS